MRRISLFGVKNQVSKNNWETDVFTLWSTRGISEYLNMRMLNNRRGRSILAFSATPPTTTTSCCSCTTPRAISREATAPDFKTWPGPSGEWRHHEGVTCWHSRFSYPEHLWLCIRACTRLI
ncbi:hypothetical protein DAI22_03g138000 [Oryza sativa Japonica Group]|nr:hypothetical protein DAI22_03g138000 [Oryza sativa Japonica Group]